MFENAAGRWTTEKALRRAQSAHGTQWHGLRGRGHSLMLGDTCIATVRQRRRGWWEARIEGWEWRPSPETARVLPTLKFAPIYGFSNSSEAKAEVMRVLAAAKKINSSA